MNVKGYTAENVISRYFRITLALEAPEIKFLGTNDVLLVGHLLKGDDANLLAFTLGQAIENNQRLYDPLLTLFNCAFLDGVYPECNVNEAANLVMLNYFGKFSTIPMFLGKPNLAIDFVDEKSPWLFKGPKLSPEQKGRVYDFMNVNGLLPCSVNRKAS